MPVADVENVFPDTISLINTLNEAQLKPIVWFASGLVEEIDKVDYASIRA